MKVIDAFPFFNELDVLEIRLHELDSVVDTFVIVESAEMHGSTKTKPFVLLENYDRFKPFWHKIQYVSLDQLQPPYTDSASGWARENFQRNALMGRISLRSGPDDIVLLSDCDEIPSANAVRAAIALRWPTLCIFNLDFFYYNVNSFVGPWLRSTIGTLAQYQRAGGLQAVRDKTNNQHDYRIIPNGGWHLSYFGDIEKLRMKIENFAHSSDSFVRDMLARDNKQMAADIAANRDIYRREGMQQFSHRASNDPRLPAHFLNNMGKYEKFTEEFFVRQNASLLEA